MLLIRPVVCVQKPLCGFLFTPLLLLLLFAFCSVEAGENNSFV